MSEAVVTLKKGEGRSLKAGGSWVYDNEIAKIEGHFENGAIVRVEDFDGYGMGKGVINQNSVIRVRMLSRDKDCQIDASFWRARVSAAWDYRKSVLGGGNRLEDVMKLPNPGIGTTGNADLNACRVIFGEADFIPGMVVDKYGDILVVESLSLGTDRLKKEILAQLLEVMAKDGIKIREIYERSDAPVRKKEGMQPFKGVIYPDGNTSPDNHQIEIMENGIRYLVDVQNGQKTGFFLDQKYNRLSMQRICKQLAMRAGQEKVRVLDCFTHMGTFALNCGYALREGGALPHLAEVTGLDISEYAVMQASENARRNGLQEIVKFRAANVLDELPRLNEAGERYDVVILDPPAFTKSREATKNAIKGYREINMKGMKLVKDGGFLATCSCSHFMTQELFTSTIAQAAKASHKRLRQVELRTQASDHPILWAADESYYLKFLIFQVVEEK